MLSIVRPEPTVQSSASQAYRRANRRSARDRQSPAKSKSSSTQPASVCTGNPLEIKRQEEKCRGVGHDTKKWLKTAGGQHANFEQRQIEQRRRTLPRRSK